MAIITYKSGSKELDIDTSKPAIVTIVHENHSIPERERYNEDGECHNHRSFRVRVDHMRLVKSPSSKRNLLYFGIGPGTFKCTSSTRKFRIIEKLHDFMKIKWVNDHIPRNANLGYIAPKGHYEKIRFFKKIFVIDVNKVLSIEYKDKSQVNESVINENLDIRNGQPAIIKMKRGTVIKADRIRAVRLPGGPLLVAGIGPGEFHKYSSGYSSGSIRKSLLNKLHDFGKTKWGAYNVTGRSGYHGYGDYDSTRYFEHILTINFNNIESITYQ